jgi:hypothetical protein
MAEIGVAFEGPFCVAESPPKLSVIPNVEWKDDSLAPPSALKRSTIERSRSIAQMRRRSWPSIQARCKECNDLFPLLFHDFIQNSFYHNLGLPTKTNYEELARDLTHPGVKTDYDGLSRDLYLIRKSVIKPFDPSDRISHQMNIILAKSLAASVGSGCPTCNLLYSGAVNFNRLIDPGWANHVYFSYWGFTQRLETRAPVILQSSGLLPTEGNDYLKFFFDLEFYTQSGTATFLQSGLVVFIFFRAV